MDNLTHSLVGLVGAKAGLEKWSGGATTACVLAANLPDIDVAAALGGPWFNLEHHRGITHSILGVVLLPVLLAGTLYLGHQAMARLRGRETGVAFVPLLAICVAMSATHPILDWTNNYGIRPFLPWNGKWYYGDLVFVVDPWIWGLLGGIGFLVTARTWKGNLAWGLPALLITVLFFVGPLSAGGLQHVAAFRAAWVGVILVILAARLKLKNGPPGPRLAQAGLVLLVLYWGVLAVAHARALKTAHLLAQKAANSTGERVIRVAAMPTFANPGGWLAMAETDQSVFSFNVNLINPTDVPVIASKYRKPEGDAAAILDQAASDPRARVLTGFARFPVATVEGDCLSGAIVHFADLRYTRPGTKNSVGNFSLDVNVECPEAEARTQ